MDHIQSRLFMASQRLNDLTGYSGIESMKREIKAQEETLRWIRVELQKARQLYASAISTRASSQREVNELLQRKHAWSPQDLERFTTLYRSDHANEQAESSTRERVSTIEKESEDAAARLNASILSRYHEEQIWSDKIRRMSTWGTWSLMGMNVLLFLVFQIGVEPWRRQRLVSGFGEKVEEMLVKEKSTTVGPKGSDIAGANPDEISGESMSVDRVLTNSMNGTNQTSGQEHTSSKDGSYQASVKFEGLRDFVEGCISERPVTLRKKDLTILVVQGIAAGLAFASVMVLCLQTR